jgi:hypothetical protein
MAKNGAKGGGRYGAVKSRAQFKGPGGRWIKRNSDTGKFMNVKADTSKFKGVRRES